MGWKRDRKLFYSWRGFYAIFIFRPARRRAKNNRRSIAAVANAQRGGCSKAEPAGWRTHKFNTSGGWLRSVTFALGGLTSINL